MELRTANENEWKKVKAFYWQLIEQMDSALYKPGWKKGIYPTRDEAILGIEKKELYVMRQNDQVVGSIVINHVQEENYQLAAWKIDAQDHEVYVIHTLAVHPQFKGLKIAQKLLEYADELAKNNGVKTIRLDVRKGNVPAIKLYERCGYTYVGAINLDFRGSDLGLFELYEKII